MSDETPTEMMERLAAMIDDETCGTWDHSDNDLASIEYAYDEITRLRVERAQLEKFIVNSPAPRDGACATCWPPGESGVIDGFVCVPCLVGHPDRVGSEEEE